MNETSEQTQWTGLQTIAERESLLLAPYAMHSVDSRGRKHPEPEHPYRGPFQRDRDRIVHSAAYRRLGDKTQVFTGLGDYHRTRLTHTLEVASIARTIGRTLKLNEDLIEALALLHDIGHPPFGHAGEDALNECLAEEGGFSHNRYALTVVEELEIRHQRFPGLNLTREVLEGQTSRIDKSPGTVQPLLEVQVVETADSITYDAHDVDDAVKLRLVSLDELKQNALVRTCSDRVAERFGSLDGNLLRKAIVHELIDFQVSAVVRICGRRLAAAGFSDAQEARRSDFVMGPGPELTEQKTQLEEFLYRRVYRHPDLVSVRGKAQAQLREMFEGYIEKPELLPRKFQTRSSEVGIRSVVGDYLAGMTDRYCMQQYRRHFSRGEGG